MKCTKGNCGRSGRYVLTPRFLQRRHQPGHKFSEPPGYGPALHEVAVVLAGIAQRAGNQLHVGDERDQTPRCQPTLNNQVSAVPDDEDYPQDFHEIEGQVSIAILEGNGEFLGKDDSTLPALPGDVLISEIAEPHGVRAKSDMRVLVTIAPPI